MFSLRDLRLVQWAAFPMIALLLGSMVDLAPDTSVGASIDADAFIAPNGKDDPPPTLSIDDVTVRESDSTATFTITRNGKAKKEVTFDIATSDLDATEGLDYEGESINLTIKKGGEVKTQSFTVSISDDEVAENAETFSVTLSNPVRATLLKPIGIGTIIDNDTAGITVDDDDGVFVLEGGETDTFSIALQSEPTADVLVTIVAAEEQLVITPSEVRFRSATWNTPQTLSVTAAEDGIDEPDPHTSRVSFVSASADTGYNGVLVTDLAVTIGDADALLVSIEGPDMGVPQQSVRFAATVNAGGTGTITYEWTAFRQGIDIANGDQATFEFTPSEGGYYIIQAIVGDDQDQNPASFVQFKVLVDVGGSVFTDDILWLAEEGITKGCNPPTNTMFCPDDPATRGQMAAFLVRALSLTDDGGGNWFVDDDGSIFETDIARLAAAGITKGCNPPANTQFCPDDPVTRGQMAAFIVRALGYSDDGGGDLFVDDNGSIFQDQIDRLATAGVTRGCNPPVNTQFCPTSNVTRGQMAAFVHRALGT